MACTQSKNKSKCTIPKPAPSCNVNNPLSPLTPIVTVILSPNQSKHLSPNLNKKTSSSYGKERKNIVVAKEVK